MASDFRIDIESSKLVTSRQEFAVLREAFRHEPDSALLRGRLATSLLVQDAFDDTIALLAGATALTSSESMILLQAHLARETRDDDLRVVALVDRLLERPADDEWHAQFLADQAKAYRRLGDTDAAVAALERALLLDPASKDACKRMAAIALDRDRMDEAIAVLDRIAGEQVSHARLHAARALVHARAGRIETSRATVALDELFHASLLDTPPGMVSLDAFNAALAVELEGHPELRFTRYGTASEQTWRVDTPLVGAAPMVRLLLDRIARTAEAYVSRIVDSDHPWARARPKRGLLHCWCVMTDGVGYETWHVHQFGWMSGVYYIQVPPSVANGEGDAGCLAFGLPEDLVGAEASARYGTRMVRPREGMLMLFPSHSYHRTFPHGAPERRICLAFDIWPAG